MADVSQTPANVQPVLTGSNPTQIKEGYSASAILAGNWLYLNTSGLLAPAQANAVATAELVGMALTSAPGANQPVKYACGGDVNPGGTVVVGMSYALSAAAAGAFAPYADLASTNRVSMIGVGITPSNLRINILNSGIAKP